MWAIIVLSSVLGGACGFARLKVWLLIPATLFVASAAVIVGSMLGFKWGIIALTVIAGASFLQFSYLIGGLVSEVPIFRAKHVSARSTRAHLLYAMQYAIGEELRSYYQVTRDLPWAFRSKMAELQARCG